jgi:hypothetical protein
VLLDQILQLHGQVLDVLCRVGNDVVLAASLVGLWEFGLQGIQCVLDLFAAPVFAIQMHHSTLFKCSCNPFSTKDRTEIPSQRLCGINKLNLLWSSGANRVTVRLVESQILFDSLVGCACHFRCVFWPPFPASTSLTTRLRKPKQIGAEPCHWTNKSRGHCHWIPLLLLRSNQNTAAESTAFSKFCPAGLLNK